VNDSMERKKKALFALCAITCALCNHVCSAQSCVLVRAVGISEIEIMNLFWSLASTFP